MDINDINIKERNFNNSMQVFSELEKILLNVFLTLNIEDKNIGLIQPFYFEKLMEYFNQYIPEQVDTIYPLFLSEIEEVPQFLEAFQSFVITIVKKAKDDNVRHINLEYARKGILKGALSPIKIENILKKNIEKKLDEVSNEIDNQIRETLDKSLVFTENLITEKEIQEFKRDFPKKNDNELIEYLKRTKLMFLFLVYIREVAGKKEFFDYIGNNLMGEIFLSENNEKYADKIIVQMNYFLDK